MKEQSNNTVGMFVEYQLKLMAAIEEERTKIEATLKASAPRYLEAYAKWNVGDKVQARPYGSCATVRNYIVKERFVSWRAGHGGHTFLGKMKISYRMQILKSDGTEHRGRVGDFIDEVNVIEKYFC